MQTTATLSLEFEAKQNQTVMRVHKQEPPLRVIRAFPLAQSARSTGHSSLNAGGRHRNGHASDRAHDNSPSPSPLQVPGSPITYAENNPSPASLTASAADPVLVHLHNVSGGLLGGDQLHMDLTIGAEAQVQLTSTSSTRIYRNRDGYPITNQVTKIAIGRDGLLEYLPDTLIPYAHSKYRQLTHIELEEGAGLFYWEVITPGREAKGECFEYDSLGIELEIGTQGYPIAIERNLLEPERLRTSMLSSISQPFESSARLGSYRYFATFYICKVGVESQTWLALEERLDKEARTISQAGQTLWAISTLAAHGLSVRAVSKSSHAIQKALPRFWQIAKAQLYQQDAVMPRKIY